MSILRIFSIRISSLLCAVIILHTAGCCCVSKVKWIEPTYVAPLTDSNCADNSDIADAERLYAAAFEQEEQCLASCVDLFYEVAYLTAHYENGLSDCNRGYLLHQSALLKVVEAGQKFRRLDPSQGLTIQRAGGEQLIPISFCGFVWQPSDFHRLIAVGDYRTQVLSTKHRQAGVGVPLVVKRCQRADEGLLPDESHFAATLRLNVNPVQHAGGDALIGSQLELYDPLRIDHANIQGRNEPIAKDTTAPLAFALRGERRRYLYDFLYTSAARETAGLRILEPYQPGKIPVVLIHGLLSDPYTWAEMVNELRAHPGLVDRFQIWVYEYPTGQAFLTSAARLRGQLSTARIRWIRRKPTGSCPTWSWSGTAWVG